MNPRFTRRNALRLGALASAAPAGLIDLARGDDLSAFEPTGEPLHFTADGYTFASLHLGNRDPYHLYWRRR